MSYLRRFVGFWRDFLIGDDLLGAGIAVGGLVLAYLLVRLGFDAYWVIPLAVVVSVSSSLWRALRRRQRARAAER
jgi:hypothetical protein